ncbi:MAG TPA: glutaminyl-peptide cyclotransferase [Pyrinomonadaceae bacterium]|nr:glutaminyl-peptide cyclotransferase [Pyrinomonadaceae bacterium]
MIGKLSTLRPKSIVIRPKNAVTRIGVALLISLALTNLHCQTNTIATNNPSPVATNSTRTTPEELVPLYGYEVVNTFPHDPDAYTQGFIYHEGKFLESTGRQGKSSLRSVELETGKVLNQVNVPTPYFAEGITVLNGKIYQLTWQHHTGFIYDAATLKKLSEFSYEGEGWGLTNDGSSLILSDGTDRIRFLDPSTFKVQKTIAVLDKRVPVARLNELEFIRGEIYANVWTEDRIARIDAKSGRVTGWIQLAGLIPRTELHDEEAVLNGIAYDEAQGRLFVTGKLWPKVFEIRIK